MYVKSDTKEKFTVITPTDSSIPANMAGEWEKLLLPYLEKTPPHVVLNLSEVAHLDATAAEMLCQVQQTFYEKGHSFVVCGLKPEVESRLDEDGLLELMNVTPTESEAWDIVQMEEIERELMEGFDEEPHT